MVPVWTLARGSRTVARDCWSSVLMRDGEEAAVGRKEGRMRKSTVKSRSMLIEYGMCAEGESDDVNEVVDGGDARPKVSQCWTCKVLVSWRSLLISL